MQSSLWRKVSLPFTVLIKQFGHIFHPVQWIPHKKSTEKKTTKKKNSGRLQRPQRKSIMHNYIKFLLSYLNSQDLAIYAWIVTIIKINVYCISADLRKNWFDKRCIRVNIRCLCLFFLKYSEYHFRQYKQHNIT